jgi:ArsR family transcriptional regulator, lead/cadmium/zinc/bismuth-responsive transcriptional repressor
MNNYSDIQSSLVSESLTAECEITIIHEEQVRQAQQALVDEDTAAGLGEIFQALADPTRLKLISALLRSEMCVCDLAATLGMSQSAISHQLKILRMLKLVKNRKEGRIVYYALDDEHIRALFELGLEHYRHRRQPE